MHILPELKYLEQKYQNQPFVVIGVHSGKFTNERETENVRQAILRYDIEHPVIVDQNFSIWQSYSVHSWPTLVLLDPEGNIGATFSGEGNRDEIDLFVEVMLDRYEKREVLNRERLPISLERNRRNPTALNYPGKVCVDTARHRLYISDTNNHRIVVADSDGKVEWIIGSGIEGWLDGSFADSRFNHPQGLALYRDKLLVADTDTHTIREIDFSAGEVRTIAGTGRQGYLCRGSGPARNMALSSPWDLAVVGDTCFIAMAGVHQIWSMDLISQKTGVFAGIGHEARVDGNPHEAAFAQPSGIASDGKHLYIADSEVSSIRCIDLINNGMVSTLGGGDLFEFGDEDGLGENVRLQHPLGITVANKTVYVADTYNHKIKAIDLPTGEFRTYLGTGRPGKSVEKGNEEFYEPGGISFGAGKLYIADTNNHRICVVDLWTDDVSELPLKISEHDGQFISRLPSRASREALRTFPVSQTIDHGLVKVDTRGFTLKLRIETEPGKSVNMSAPFQYMLLGKDSMFRSPDLNTVRSRVDWGGEISIPIKLKIDHGQERLDVDLMYFYCEQSNTGLCKIRSVRHSLMINIAAGAEREFEITDKVV
jgi:DNA-binding beta-propeller fold protein YncE